MRLDCISIQSDTYDVQLHISHWIWRLKRIEHIQSISKSTDSSLHFQAEHTQREILWWLIEWLRKQLWTEQKLNTMEVSDLCSIETTQSRFIIDEHIRRLYLIMKTIYNEDIRCEDIQCWLNLQRDNQPR